MHELNEIERALLRALVQDRDTPRPVRALQLNALRAHTRSMTGCGFITEIGDTPDAYLYSDDVSLRWGARVVAVINDTEQVGTVVYVDAGRITAVEASTFGGTPWPEEIRKVEVKQLGQQSPRRS